MSRFIPEEVVEQILCKLPIKPLSRFKTVSKQWYRLIITLKSSRFLLVFSSKENGFVFCIEKNGTFEEYARYEAPLEEGRMGQLCFDCCANGLVCFSDYGEHVVIWNPSNRRSLLLPESYAHPPNQEWIGQRFIFGFVFDHITNDYKILRTGNAANFVEIFRFSTGSWEVVNHYEVPLMCTHGCQVDLNGISYWIGTNGRLFPIIVSFDGHEESFGSIYIDVSLSREEWFRCYKWLFLFKESLVLVHSVDNGGLFYINKDGLVHDQFVCTHKIWKMENMERRSLKLWCELHFDERVSPVGFTENGEFLWVNREFRFVSITLGHEFTRRSISMNLENTSDFCPHGYNAGCVYECSNYVENFALLDVIWDPSSHGNAKSHHNIAQAEA